MLDKLLIKTAIEQKKNQVIPMNYSLADRNLIKRFQLDTITGGKEYSHYGHISGFDPKEFLATLGNNSKEDVARLTKVIQEIVNSVCGGYSRKHAWVSIRATKPTHEYDTARWHTDGNFFMDPRSLARQQSNFITALKGAGTLMIDPHPSKEVLDKIQKLWQNLYLEFKDELKKRNPANYFKKQNSQEFRKEFEKILADEQKKQLTNDEGLVFMVGNLETALVHSEPPKHEDRIFLKILPGYSYEIEGWKGGKARKK
jgi:hypothetical protein